MTLLQMQGSPHSQGDGLLNVAEYSLDCLDYVSRRVDPWGLYSLIVIGAFTLIVPVYMLFYSSKHMAVMTRLTPDYERPKGH